MEEKRKKLKELLSRSNVTTGLFNELKNCISTKEDINTIDVWFERAIGSLFYKPNKKLLVLCGKQGVGKTEFARRISPISNAFWSSWQEDNESIYKNFIVEVDDMTIDSMKKFYSLVLSDAFRIITNENRMPVADKRLCSFIMTTNYWNIQERKDTVVLNVESIDFERFNQIDKLKLWKELYCTYSPLFQ